MYDQFEVNTLSFGEFLLGDRNLFGELKLDGDKTNLRVNSHQFIPLNEIKDGYIAGELSNKTKVSLIDCNLPPVPGSHSSKEGTRYYADIFPHFVALGDDHVRPKEETVTAIHWEVPDLSAVFNDFDAFGTSLSPERFIEEIVAEQERQLDRKIPIGPDPQIHYFTGRFEAYSCETHLGTFSVNHGYEYNFGGTSGVWLKNKMTAALRFGKQIRFSDAIARANAITSFLGIVAGRPQNIESIFIELSSNPARRPLKIILSLPIRYENVSGQISPGPSDVLISGMENPNEFSAVLNNWLASDDEMDLPRERFWDSFKKQNNFDADRIIAAANLFDTIPGRYYPKYTSLGEEFSNAIEQARTLFEPLPKTPEREAVMRELSRIMRPTLRTKIKHWARDLILHHKDEYEDLDFVIDKAVKCRNFFVHGGNPEFDYFEEFNLFVFLTRTLELCYVYPEFSKGGWNLKRYLGHHPFGAYTRGYQYNLRELRLKTGEAVQ